MVAIKVIDIDDADYRAFGESKEEQIQDFRKEIRILRNAGESDAPNLNRMVEAFSVHSQLWLVMEYCPGGSVKTLVSLIALAFLPPSTWVAQMTLFHFVWCFSSSLHCLALDLLSLRGWNSASRVERHL